METIIANLTNDMINDIKFFENEVNRDNMLSWLYCQHDKMLNHHIAYSESPGIVMTKLVAIKQMIETVNLLTD